MKTETERALGQQMRRSAWTVKALAQDLDCGLSTIYEAIARGDIKAVRFGRTIRIPPGERDRLMGEAAAE